MQKKHHEDGLMHDMKKHAKKKKKVSSVKHSKEEMHEAAKHMHKHMR